MCRLFGFRSVFSSRVHSSLLGADNALVHQSERHPDGWGVAYYQEGSPHIVKSTNSALECALFRRLSGVVTSHSVVAHLRKATLGDLSVINTHPFQYGPWVFAHNGNIKDFDRVRPLLLDRIKPELRRFILGETDSEVIFFLIISRLSERGNLQAGGHSVVEIAASIKEVVAEAVAIAGDYCVDDDGGADETYLTFILTNGTAMAAHHGGKRLYYSSYKRCCPERDTCFAFAPECEQESRGHVNHLIFSSEPLQGDNVWVSMSPGQVVGVDSRMMFYDSH